MLEKIKKKLNIGPSYSQDEISDIIAEAVRDLHIRKVIYTTDSKDGIIRMKDDLTVYIVSDGLLGYGGIAIFDHRMQKLTKRFVDCYAFDSKTTEYELSQLNGVVAYG